MPGRAGKAIAAVAAALLLAACRSGGPVPPPVPPPQTPEPPRQDPEELTAGSAQLLSVINRPSLFPEHTALAAFADGFQRSTFLPSTRGSDRDTSRAEETLDRVLSRWPAPLRGYHYTVQVVETDYPVAWAYGAGRIDLTSNLVSGLGLSDSELEALVARAVAHTELQHQRAFLTAAPRGFHEDIAVLEAIRDGENDAPPPVWASSLIARQKDFGYAKIGTAANYEADALASFYLESTGIGLPELASALGKLRAFERRTAGLYRNEPAYRATRVDPSRIRRLVETSSMLLRDANARIGTGRNGEVRAGFQPLWTSRYGPLVHILAVLTLGPAEQASRIGDLFLQMDGEEVVFADRSADELQPATSVAVLYRGQVGEQIPLGQMGEAALRPSLERIHRWTAARAVLFDPAGGSAAASARPRLPQRDTGLR